MAEELIDEFGDELNTITLISGIDGRFEVTADGRKVFSKKEAGRHANPGEVADLIKKGNPTYDGSAQTGANADMST